MIIAFSGYAKSGKDTAAEIIKSEYPSFQIKKFSQKLKDIASILTGIPSSMFEQQFIKDAEISGWGMTGREMLQKIGTDAIRDGLHKDAWVMSLFSDYHSNDKWLITDCRFPNEYAYVKDFGGMVFRIERPNVSPVNAHPSETALDGYKFDATIVNDGDVDKLKQNILSIINQNMNNESNS